MRAVLRFLFRLLLGLLLMIPLLIVFTVRYFSFSHSFKSALRAEGMTAGEAGELAAEYSPLALRRLFVNADRK